MTRYGLSGKKLQEVQAVNAVRKAAVQGGMTMEQAMQTWQSTHKNLGYCPPAILFVSPASIACLTSSVKNSSGISIAFDDGAAEVVFSRLVKILL